MKKKTFLIILLSFVLLLFTSMIFESDDTHTKVDQQISDFDDSIQVGDEIADGNIDYEIKYDYEGNKLANLNAAVSNKISGIFNKFFDFIKKIIKKIVS